MSDDQATIPLSTVQAAFSETWRSLSTFDGQTILTTAIGVVVAIVIFWLGYRKTIGAREERLRAGNTELCAAVIKRVAVERQVMTREQFEVIRDAKAYKSQIPAERLIDFDDTLDSVLNETINNDFIDTTLKNRIQDVTALSRFDNSLYSLDISNDNALDVWNILMMLFLLTISGLCGSLASLFYMYY